MPRRSSTKPHLFSRVKTYILGLPKSRPATRIVTHTKRRPLLSFLILLGVLLLLIIVGSAISKLQQKPASTSTPVKSVQVYSIGTSPKISLQARVEKAGVVTVLAQSGGIVDAVLLNPGDSVTRGQAIVDLSTTPSGANSSALQAGIANKQYQLASETYAAQKDIIAKQREIAEKTDENTEELRKISESSLSDTKDVLNQNKDLLNTVNDQISQLESAPQDPDTAATLAQLRQARVQLSSGIAQLQNQVRNLEYSTNKDNPPTELTTLQKDIALKQLDLQEKSLLLQKEIAGMSAAAAHIMATMMHPASPFSGIVERVNVKKGQNIAPSTVIATVSSNDQSVTAVVLVPESIAQNLTMVQPSTIYIQDKPISIFPQYISQNATEGQLYSVTFCLPEEYAASITDQSFLSVQLPIGSPNESTITPYIPIDTVFQSEDTAYVFVVENNTAVYRKVTLGNVYGQFVEVRSGVSSGDLIINDRNVINGDTVKVK